MYCTSVDYFSRHGEGGKAGGRVSLWRTRSAAAAAVVFFCGGGFCSKCPRLCKVSGVVVRSRMPVGAGAVVRCRPQMVVVVVVVVVVARCVRRGCWCLGVRRW